jgi:hypothetical protein
VRHDLVFDTAALPDPMKGTRRLPGERRRLS